MIINNGDGLLRYVNDEDDGESRLPHLRVVGLCVAQLPPSRRLSRLPLLLKSLILARQKPNQGQASDEAQPIVSAESESHQHCMPCGFCIVL